jgi:hypothetical protein
MANDTDIFGELPKSATPSDSDIFKDASAPKAASSGRAAEASSVRTVRQAPAFSTAAGDGRGHAGSSMGLWASEGHV